MITPSSETIRNALVERATKYVDSHGSSFSAIGLAAVNDSKFLARVQKGENFSVKTYQKVMDWLDAAERENAA
jgi:hypothetical protein